MRYDTEDAAKMLQTQARKEFDAFVNAHGEWNKALTALKKEAPNEYNAWAGVHDLKVSAPESELKRLTKLYQTATQAVESALKKAAPNEWNRYEEAVKERNAAEEALAKAAPHAWARFRFTDAF